MMDKFYLNIIVDAESSVYKADSANTTLYEYYINAVVKKKKNISKDEFYSNLLKVIEVFEEDIDEQKHKYIILSDIIPEKTLFMNVEIDLKKYQPDKKFWRFDYPLQEYRIKSHKKSIKRASKKIKPEINSHNIYENYGWFKVGLLFANGDMDLLLKKYNNNATQIAKAKFNENWKKYRPYISDSINKDVPASKDIFKSRSKLLKIKEYCDKNGILVIPSFLENLPPE